ncbi:hypothetical protein, partial [Nostoc sp. 'Peltigera malacea cyanobiont' DB3992]|uniref:hypothetical protein n=1 Tax=Nostoc sp. 'Peltigera malacea cyanobiont' DB3992 TaxID=1206980 RepID=UPI003FA5B55B
MSVTGWYLFGNTFIGVIRKAIALTLSIQMYYVTLQSLLFYKKAYQYSLIYQEQARWDSLKILPSYLNKCVSG